MTVAVLVPWRFTADARAAAWGHVRSHLEATYPDWSIHVGVHEQGEWCKAEAVDAALAQTDADVLVIHDADVLVADLDRAVAALTDAPWVVPHVQVHRLTEAATAHYLATGVDNGEREKGCPYVGVVGGGVTVLRRDVYEDCPLDARFVGWNLEDVAWGMALTVLHGWPVRLDAPLLHLWHPPQARRSRNTPVGDDGPALAHQYRSAFRRWERDPRNPDGYERMRALVDEHLTCRA